MKVSSAFLRRSILYFNSLRCCCNTSFNLSQTERIESSSRINKSMHCYKTLYPWENLEEFSEYLISCVEYNKGGLLVLNKPFGIKIHGNDKPGARPPAEVKFIKSSIPECNYTVEDSLPELQRHFNEPNLSIIKSAEKYTSGIVLLSASNEVTAKVKKSFNVAKLQHKPHLIHWAVTLGYPVVPFRKEKVAIKFVETETDKIKMKLPVIVTDMSKRDCKLKKVYSVNVESRTLAKNEKLSTSLIEIASSSVRYHFVRVYASSRVAPILGDILYGCRMKTLLGVPVKIPLQKSHETGFEPLPAQLSEMLSLPRGMAGQLMIPTMLHLRRIILPNYYIKNQDFSISVKLPPHFKWTVNQLNLLSEV